MIDEQQLQGDGLRACGQVAGEDEGVVEGNVVIVGAKQAETLKHIISFCLDRVATYFVQIGGKRIAR
jgi:hypothetical protein